VAASEAAATANQLSHQINGKQNQCQGQLHDRQHEHNRRSTNTGTQAQTHHLQPTHSLKILKSHHCLCVCVWAFVNDYLTPCLIDVQITPTPPPCASSSPASYGIHFIITVLVQRTVCTTHVRCVNGHQIPQ